MSLFSIMNSLDQASNGSNSLLTPLLSTGTSANIASQLQALLEKEQSNASVAITPAAKQKAAASADSDKSAAVLTKELRTALDADIKKRGAGNADMTGYSARGLATIALNEGGTFSAVEVAQAKSELRQRDRQALLDSMSGTGFTLDGLKAYASAQVSARLSMSAEEVQLRDANPRLR